MAIKAIQAGAGMKTMPEPIKALKVLSEGKLALSRDGNGCVSVRLARTRLPPARVEFKGKAYVRLYSLPSPSESIVRNNIDLFVEKVFCVVVENCKGGLLRPSSRNPNNTLDYVQKLCLDFDGIGPSGFVSKTGEPLRRNKAFAYAIRQFFKDERFAMSVCLDAIWFFKESCGNGKF